MTLENYSLQFHVAQAEDAQSVQNRFLAREALLAAHATEQARVRAKDEEETIAAASETENPEIPRDKQEGNEGKGEERRRSLADRGDQRRKEVEEGGSQKPEGRGLNIDIIA